MYNSNFKLCMWIHNDRNNARVKEIYFKIGYGINYKYEGMLSHTFDRCYVVTKFELPKVEDLKLTMISYDSTCQYLGKAKSIQSYPTQYIRDMKNYFIEIAFLCGLLQETNRLL